MMLDEIIAQGMEAQGLRPFHDPSSGDLLLPTKSDAKYLDITKLARFLSHHVVVGGKSKEQVPTLNCPVCGSLGEPTVDEHGVFCARCTEEMR